jgi:hypothetical protein
VPQLTELRVLDVVLGGASWVSCIRPRVPGLAPDLEPPAAWHSNSPSGRAPGYVQVDAVTSPAQRSCHSRSSRQQLDRSLRAVWRKPRGAGQAESGHRIHSVDSADCRSETLVPIRDFGAIYVIQDIRGAARKDGRQRRGRQPLEAVLVPLGAAAMLAAVVGGGLQASDVKVPIIDSLGRQILLGVVGLTFVVVGLASRWMLIPAVRRAKRLESDYNDLILKTNDLWFAPGGIKDLLGDYRASGSEESWARVQNRARTNEERLTALRTGKDRLPDLAGNPVAAHALDELLNAKGYFLYDRLRRLPRGLPQPEQVDELIENAAFLDDAMTSRIKSTQKALLKLRNEARDRRVDLEARIFR